MATMKKTSRKKVQLKVTLTPPELPTPVQPPPVPPKSVPPSSSRARIRMYRVGLGDCFLLTFYTTPPQHMLIDCGMFKGSRLNKDQKEQDLQRAIVENIASETGKKLDVVVVTHEHMDHVSIFNSAKDIFEGVDFEEAWFGWVEDPKNDAAKKLREKYEGLKQSLATALASLQGLAGSDPDQYEALHSGVASVAEFTGLGAKGEIAEQPRAAMNFVDKRAKKKRYGSPGDEWTFAGTKVHVLGPPTAEKQLRKMERAGASYDRAFGVMDETAESSDLAWFPFSAQWRRPFKKDPDWNADPRIAAILARYREARDAWRRIDNLALDASSDLALQMDKHINNTSLALAFEFDNGDVLLFPGDAQVGNWDSWFEIKKEGLDVNKLLERTIFYKVGHHGSHNATLKPALEKMTNPKLVAMIPTNEKFARDSKHWVMPAPNLNRALKEHTQERLLRIDQGFSPVEDPLREDKDAEWADLKKNVRVTDLYIDYFV